MFHGSALMIGFKEIRSLQVVSRFPGVIALWVSLPFYKIL